MKDPKAKLQLVEKEDPKVESKPVEKGLKDLKDHADDGLDKVSKNLKGFADDGLDKVSKAASQVMDQVLPR